jgi:hypothetical protein
MAQGSRTGDQWGEKTVEGKIVGRNRAIVPPQEVEDLAALGCNNKEIYTWFGITEGALFRNFAAELEKGRNRLRQSLRRAMLQNACVHLQPAIQIFLAKNLLGMSDSGLTGEDNKPLPWSDTDDESVEEEDEEELNNLEDTE